MLLVVYFRANSSSQTFGDPFQAICWSIDARSGPNTTHSFKHPVTFKNWLCKQSAEPLEYSLQRVKHCFSFWKVPNAYQ